MEKVFYTKTQTDSKNVTVSEWKFTIPLKISGELIHDIKKKHTKFNIPIEYDGWELVYFCATTNTEEENSPPRHYEIFRSVKYCKTFSIDGCKEEVNILIGVDYTHTTAMDDWSKVKISIPKGLDYVLLDNNVDGISKILSKFDRMIKEYKKV